MYFKKLNFRFSKVRKMLRWECLSADDKRPCIVFILSFAWLTCKRPKGNLIIGYLVASYSCLKLHSIWSHRTVSLLGWLSCALQNHHHNPQQQQQHWASEPEGSFLGHLLRFSLFSYLAAISVRTKPPSSSELDILSHGSHISSSSTLHCTLFHFSGPHKRRQEQGQWHWS